MNKKETIKKLRERQKMGTAGLYDNINLRKLTGTSRPGKGTVSDKMLKRAKKTAKK